MPSRSRNSISHSQRADGISIDGIFISTRGFNPFVAPMGVQLHAYLSAVNVDVQWKGLTNSLAGLFCASLYVLFNLRY